MDEILLVKDYLSPINGLFSHIDYDFEFVEKPVLDLLVFTIKVYLSKNKKI